MSPVRHCRGDAVPARPGGYALLEVLVAFAIAVLALAVLYRGGLDGLLGARRAERMQEAVSRAQSRIAAVCPDAGLAPGERSGDDGGGYSWRTVVSRDRSTLVRPFDDTGPGNVVRADLLTVRVTLSWRGMPGTSQVTLTTKCVTAGRPDRP